LWNVISDYWLIGALSRNASGSKRRSPKASTAIFSSSDYCSEIISGAALKAPEILLD
jgi:hypothetical protein